MTIALAVTMDNTSEVKGAEMIIRFSLLILTVMLTSCVSTTSESGRAVSVATAPSKPDMSGVDFETKMIMERRCISAQDEGIPAYWACLRKELKSIGVE